MAASNSGLRQSAHAADMTADAVPTADRVVLSLDGREATSWREVLHVGRRARAQGVAVHVRLRGLDWRQRLRRACLAQALCTPFAAPCVLVALENLNHRGGQVGEARRQLELEGFSVSSRAR
jgi:hypothetical protein